MTMQDCIAYLDLAIPGKREDEEENNGVREATQADIDAFLS